MLLAALAPALEQHVDRHQEQEQSAGDAERRQPDADGGEQRLADDPEDREQPEGDQDRPERDPSPRGVVESAELAGVSGLLRRSYGKLSGGQQRRVQFALALCGNPRLLFLDEPSVGMDIEARGKLWSAIRALVAEGASVVLTTHYLEEAEALADRVCVMARGRVASEGSVDALRARIGLKRVWCATRLPLAEVAAWPEVAEARVDGVRLCLSTEHPELLVRRLLGADAQLTALEVRAAGLAEAFVELTRDDRVAPLPEAA